MSNITKLLILLAIGLILAAASVWFIGGKKKEYDIVATVQARPYQLFPYLVEPELKKKWMSGLVNENVVVDPADESEDAGTVKEDALLDATFDIDGESLNFKGTIIRYAKNEIASFKYRNDDMHRTSFFRLKGKNDTTQLEYRRIVRLDGMRRFSSVFADDSNQADIERELDRLVSMVESEVDNSIPEPDKDLATVGVESNEGSSSKDSSSEDNN